jgi:hypothetical protein
MTDDEAQRRLQYLEAQIGSIPSRYVPLPPDKPRLLFGELRSGEILGSTNLVAVFSVSTDPVNIEGPDNSTYQPTEVNVHWNEFVNVGLDDLMGPEQGFAQYVDNWGAYVFRPLCGLRAKDWYCLDGNVTFVYEGDDPPEEFDSGPFETKAEAETACALEWYCTPEGCVSVPRGDPPPEGWTGGPFDSEQQCEDDGCYDWYCTPDGCVNVPEGDPAPEGALDGPFETESECATACQVEFWCVGGACIAQLESDPPPEDALSGPFDTEEECIANFYCDPGTTFWACFSNGGGPGIPACDSYVIGAEPGPIEGFPYHTSEEACNAEGCPPFDEGWYCVCNAAEEDCACFHFLSPPVEGVDYPTGYHIHSGPYTDMSECEAACNAV